MTKMYQKLGFLRNSFIKFFWFLAGDCESIFDEKWPRSFFDQISGWTKMAKKDQLDLDENGF